MFRGLCVTALEQDMEQLIAEWLQYLADSNDQVRPKPSLFRFMLTQ